MTLVTIARPPNIWEMSPTVASLLVLHIFGVGWGSTTPTASIRRRCYSRASGTSCLVLSLFVAAKMLEPLLHTAVLGVERPVLRLHLYFVLARFV